MRHLTLIVGAIAALAFIVVAAAAPEVEIRQAPLTWQQAAQSDGAVLYAEACAACHGSEAQGDGPAAPALATPVPDLTRLALGNGGVFPAAEVEKMITGQDRVAAHGSLEMPVWGKAFEDVRADRKPGARWGFARLRILALTEYLESIQAQAETE